MAEQMSWGDWQTSHSNSLTNILFMDSLPTTLTGPSNLSWFTGCTLTCKHRSFCASWPGAPQSRNLGWEPYTMSFGLIVNQAMRERVSPTTNLELIFCRICFSFSAIASPFRFLIRFFSSFLHAYILPVARTWQAHTSPKPPLPRTRYILNVYFVTAWLQTTLIIVIILICVYSIHSAELWDTTWSSRNTWKHDKQ